MMTCLPHTLVCVLVFLKVEGTSEVAITIIKGAVAKGAVCLDGSPPAYQFDAGFGDGVHSWLVHMQGGGWCNSVNDCHTRAYSHYGSSKKMKSFDYNFTGILSNKQELNPSFYNWNRVVLRYCDGSSFTGDIEAVDPVQNILATPQADPGGLFAKCKQDINACSTDQIQKLQDFRSEFLEAFLVAQNGSSRRGWFVNNCFTHGQCELVLYPSDGRVFWYNLINLLKFVPSKKVLIN